MKIKYQGSSAFHSHQEVLAVVQAGNAFRNKNPNEVKKNDLKQRRVCLFESRVHPGQGLPLLLPISEQEEMVPPKQNYAQNEIAVKATDFTK